MAESQEYTMNRLKDLNYELSPSQPNTQADGNCFLWAILDQMKYDPILSEMNKQWIMKQKDKTSSEIVYNVLGFRLWICDFFKSFIDF